MKRIVVGLDATPAMAPVVNWVERIRHGGRAGRRV